METIYKKSITGQEEITSRAHGLSSRLRRCLILIDGKRTLVELKTLLASDDVDTLLSELLTNGYILLGETTHSDSLNAPTKHNLEETPSDSLSPNNTTRRPLSFAERKQRGIRILQDALGPMGEDIAIKIERAQDDDTLNRLLEKGYEYIKELRNKTIADKYRADVRLP